MNRIRNCIGMNDVEFNYISSVIPCGDTFITTAAYLIP